MFKAYEFLKPNLKWQVGNGRSIPINSEWWHQPQVHLDNIHMVSDLLDHSGNWKDEEINRMYYDEQTKSIFTTPISKYGALDRPMWTKSASGEILTADLPVI